MDAIEALDQGAYAHFTFQAKAMPNVVSVMVTAYYISSYIGVCVLIIGILGIHLFLNRKQSALVATLSLVSAILIIELLRFAVPRSRPQDAVQWIGDEAKSGTFPSASVFLFLLCMILLGNALWENLSARWSRGVFIVLAASLTVWVCLSQFYLALHYVSDVIGAITGATLIGWIAIRLISAAAPPRPAEASDAPPADAIQDLSRATAIKK